MSENECKRCKHKLPKNVCGASESQNYNQNIEPDNSCDYFLESPAQNHYAKALQHGVIKANDAAISEFEAAIELGLPQDDEMCARYFLGSTYSNLVNTDLAGEHIEQLTATPEFQNAINQMEKAVLMDSEGKYGYFSENRALLGKLDVLYSFQADAIQKKEGADDAIAFYETKLQLFDYLPSTPMLIMLLQLGALYYENKGDKERARKYFRKILEADVVDPVDEGGMEANVRQQAENNLKIAEDMESGVSGKKVAAASSSGSWKVFLVLIVPAFLFLIGGFYLLFVLLALAAGAYWWFKLK
ncbi:MAG: hypothetical protein KJ935_07740 [Candidatus Omnitrophica bacterium]|nr:hypothetical protein [Candidatus Omnitrophota bacterium]